MGYGDVVPVTLLERVLGAFLMIIAIVLLVSITSQLSAILTNEGGKKYQAVEREKGLIAHLEFLNQEVKSLHNTVDALQSHDRSQ